MCNFFSQTIIPVPDKELNQKQKYSSDFIKIFKCFLDAFTLKQIPEKEWSYIIEHVFPALRYLSTKEFLISDFSEKDLIETKMNGYHFRPHGWIPENSTLKAPLVGLEIEFYHQNRSIYNKFSNFFYFQHDGSLRDERGGTELTTRPLPIESLLKKMELLICYAKNFSRYSALILNQLKKRGYMFTFHESSVKEV